MEFVKITSSYAKCKFIFQPLVITDLF